MAATVEPDWAWLTPAGLPGASAPSLLDAAMALVVNNAAANTTAQRLRMNFPLLNYLRARYRSPLREQGFNLAVGQTIPEP
jgi:hypothetical protein